MSRSDRALIAGIALLAVMAWPIAAAASGAGRVAIVSGPSGSTSLQLAEDSETEIVGRLGTVRVRVRGGAVSVTESECPDHVCLDTGAVSAPGSVIACVPNAVIVRVGGGDADGFDARVR